MHIQKILQTQTQLSLFREFASLTMLTAHQNTSSPAATMVNNEKNKNTTIVACLLLCINFPLVTLLQSSGCDISSVIYIGSTTGGTHRGPELPSTYDICDNLAGDVASPKGLYDSEFDRHKDRIHVKGAELCNICHEHPAGSDWNSGQLNFICLHTRQRDPDYDPVQPNNDTKFIRWSKGKCDKRKGNKKYKLSFYRLKAGASKNTI